MIFLWTELIKNALVRLQYLIMASSSPNFIMRSIKQWSQLNQPFIKLDDIEDVWEELIEIKPKIIESLRRPT